MSQVPRPSGRGRGGEGGRANEWREGAPPTDVQRSRPTFSQPPPYQQPYDDSLPKDRRFNDNALPMQQPTQRQRQWDDGATNAHRPSPKKNALPPTQGAQKSGQGAPLAISRPTPVPQWSVGAAAENGQDQRSYNGQYHPPSGRGQAPQRPPRPRHVPSMLDASRIQDHTPIFQYKPRPTEDMEQEAQMGERGQYVEDHAPSPFGEPSFPGTQAAAASTIPDFPLPAPLVVRRSANLRPPPTTRRGFVSQYSNASYVSPIQEESPRMPSSHQSYASSAAIPANWGADSPQGDPYDRERNLSVEDDIVEEGRESRGSIGDDGEERGLVRSASLVVKGKPTVVMNKTPERADQKAGSGPGNKLAKMGKFGPIEMEATRTDEISGAAAKPSARQGPKVLPQLDSRPKWPLSASSDAPAKSVDDPVPTGTEYREEPNSSSEPNLKSATAKTTKHWSAISLESRLNGNSRLEQDESRNYSRTSLIQGRPDLDASPESRESVSSLPELIRRATRLAAMIDKGRRPASRLNALSDFPSDIDISTDDEKRRSGLSGMLAAFPPPGLASENRTPTSTPDHERNPRGKSAWLKNSDGSPRNSNGRRRCCGLPIYAFLLVLVTLLLVIAAAVVVPVEILVIHKAKPSTAQIPATGCQASTVCENGGIGISSGNACSCVCANGFTGTTCSTAGDSSCTLTSVVGVTANYENVTLGFAIPRLITQAEKNFSMPLIAEVILSQFSAAGISCSAENALVTFDGWSERVGFASSPVTSSSAGTATAVPVKPRQAYIATGVGTIIAQDTAAPTSVTQASPTASAGTSSFVVTERIVDFARVAVLFVLQQQQLNNAIMAQTAIQQFFTWGSVTGFGEAGNLSLGNGNKIDFNNFNINVGSGNVGRLTNNAERLRYRRS